MSLTKTQNLIILYFAIFLSSIYFGTQSYKNWSNPQKYTMDVGVPAAWNGGLDFKQQVGWAENLVHNGYDAFIKDTSNNYPPFMTIFQSPFILLGQTHAYWLQVFLIFLGLWIAIYFMFWVLIEKSSWPISFVFTYLLYSSYPLQFALERGGADSIALAFMWISLYLFQKRKVRTAWSFLCIPVQMKVYPLALAFFFHSKQRWYHVWGFVLLNIGLLFILGWRAFKLFGWQVYWMTKDLSPHLAPFNHSVKSWYLQYILPLGFPSYLSEIICAICIVVFAVKGLQIFFYKKDSTHSISMTFICHLGMAFTIMSLITAVSFDYKLSIHYPIFLGLISYIFLNINNLTFSVKTWLLFLCVAVSTLFWPPFWIYSKAPSLLLIFLLYTIGAYKLREVPGDLTFS